MNRRRALHCLAASAAVLATAAPAQMPDMALAAKWEKVQIVHYEVVGQVAIKGHQIPPTDADLYADITDTVRLSFDWDRKKGVIVGKPAIVNETGKATNVMGLDKLGGKGRCPTGKINGTYEHFDVVEVRQDAPRKALELVGKRIHPETQVAEACSNNLKTYKGATKEVKEHIMPPPDPQMLAYGKMLNKPPIRISDDGKSFIMTAQNSPWVWTFTPTAK
jgi:hypothetical protein